jgi:hypothetical protein
MDARDRRCEVDGMSAELYRLETEIAQNEETLRQVLCAVTDAERLLAVYQRNAFLFSSTVEERSGDTAPYEATRLSLQADIQNPSNCRTPVIGVGITARTIAEKPGSDRNRSGSPEIVRKRIPQRSVCFRNTSAPFKGSASVCTGVAVAAIASTAAALSITGSNRFRTTVSAECL